MKRGEFGRINAWFLSGMIFFWMSFLYYLMEYAFASNFYLIWSLGVLVFAVVFTKLTIDFRSSK